MALGVRVQEILSIFVLHNNPNNFLVPIGITGHLTTNYFIFFAPRGKNREQTQE